MEPLESGIIVLDTSLGIEEVVARVTCIPPNEFLEFTEDEKRIAEKVAKELQYNDTIVNFVDFKRRDLTFTYNFIQFSHRKAQLEGRIKGERIDPASVDGVLECQDGIIAGRRPATQLYREMGLEKTIQTIPAGLMISKDFSGKNPILETFYRELKEETALSPDDIENLLLLGFSRDIRYRGFGANFRYHAPLSFSEVEGRWHQARDRNEYEELIRLPKNPEEIMRYILQHDEIVPLPRGGLSLYGRSEWGTEWFNELIRKSEGRIAILSYT